VQNEETSTASRLTIDATRSVFRASIRAVCPDRRKNGNKDEDGFHFAGAAGSIFSLGITRKSKIKIKSKHATIGT
jgi:hypothetical protein